MSALDDDTAYELAAEFPVARSVLFNAFIDEEKLRRMWGVSSISVDARPNGQARALLEIDGERWDFTITYREVVPPDVLRWVVHFDRFPGKEIRVALLFKTTAGGAGVTVRMENFDTPEERDANRGAWEAGLATLKTLLANE